MRPADNRKRTQKLKQSMLTYLFTEPKVEIPDVLDAAGIKREFVDFVDYELDEDEDYTRRTATINYKMTDDSSKRQVDTWLQTNKKGSTIWSIFLKGRRFVTENKEEATATQEGMYTEIK